MANSTDRAFLLLAGLCLVGGVALGIVMGVRRDFALAPVHAHLNLLGWASLALCGLVHRAYPRLAGRRMRVAHLVLSGGGAVLFPFALWLELAFGFGGLLPLASLLWLAGAVLFVALVARLRPDPGGPAGR